MVGEFATGTTHAMRIFTGCCACAVVAAKPTATMAVNASVRNRIDFLPLVAGRTSCALCCSCWRDIRCRPVHCQARQPGGLLVHRKTAGKVEHEINAPFIFPTSSL